VTTTTPNVRRLGATDVALARRTFALLREVFAEPAAPLSDEYLAALLARDEFWAFAALQDETPVGGITAHALRMTHHEATELFVFDLAVDPRHQRRGIGRLLLETLRREAGGAGLGTTFVAADQDDRHALAFYAALGGEPAPATIFTWT